MMIEQATVVAYENGIATVQCQAKSSCGSCSAQSACGTKSLSALTGEKYAPRFNLKVSEELKIGEQIQLGLPEQTLLISVFWLYCIPLAVIILSTLGFSQIFDNELWVTFGLCITTGITFWLIKKWLSYQKEHFFEPIYLGRLPL